MVLAVFLFGVVKKQCCLRKREKLEEDTTIQQRKTF